MIEMVGLMTTTHNVQRPGMEAKTVVPTILSVTMDGITIWTALSIIR